MQQLDTQLVTQAEYARHRGVSREAVRRAVQTGRITAFGPDQRVNAALADSQWSQNTRPRIRSGHAAGPMPDAGTAEPRPNGAPAYDESRARREHADAALAELRLQREVGCVWDREDVLGVVGDTVTRLRASLERLPDQLAPLLVAMAGDEAAMRAELRQRIEEALTEMSGGFSRLARE